MRQWQVRDSGNHTPGQCLMKKRKQSNKAEVIDLSIGDTLQSQHLGGDGERDRNTGTTSTS